MSDLKEKAREWLTTDEGHSRWHLQPHVDSLTALLEEVQREARHGAERERDEVRARADAATALREAVLEAFKNHQCEWEATVRGLREELKYTSHMDGLGMGDQRSESVCDEILRRMGVNP